MTTISPEGLARPASRFAATFRRSGAMARALALALLVAFSSLAAIAVWAQESTPDATPAVEPTPSAEMPRLELELEELNDSGIDGTVTLYDAGNDTIVEFDVEGVGEEHPAHIHEGVCGDLEPEPAFPLVNVDEDGESITVVDISLDDLLAEDYAIDMHLAPDQLGTLIACANIDGEPELPAGATPGASPMASPDATPSEDAAGVGGTIPDQTQAATEVSTEMLAATEMPAATEAPAETDAPVTDQPTETPTAISRVTQPAGTDGSDGTGGATTTVPVPPQVSVVPGDGTAGISGKGTPVDPTGLPQRAGVGAALVWPDNPATAITWASAAGSVVLGATAVVVRRGERRSLDTPSRWTRMGI